MRLAEEKTNLYTLDENRESTWKGKSRHRLELSWTVSQWICLSSPLFVQRSKRNIFWLKKIFPLKWVASRLNASERKLEDKLPESEFQFWKSKVRQTIKPFCSSSMHCALQGNSLNDRNTCGVFSDLEELLSGLRINELLHWELVPENNRFNVSISFGIRKQRWESRQRKEIDRCLPIRFTIFWPQNHDTKSRKITRNETLNDGQKASPDNLIKY